MRAERIKQVARREALVIAGFLILGLIIFSCWGIFTRLASPKVEFSYHQIQGEPKRYEFTIAGHGFQIELEGKVSRDALYKEALELAEHTSIIKPSHLYNFLSASNNFGLFIAFGGGYLCYLVVRLLIWTIMSLKG
jgi:hypothetical protein